MASPKRRPRLRIDTLEAREVPAAAPQLLNDINVGGGNSDPLGFTALRALTYFTATDAASRGLYKTTGGSFSAVELTGGAQTATGAPAIFDNHDAVDDDKILFAGNLGAGAGEELYYVPSDGSAGMTVAKDINAGPGSSFPQLLTTLTVGSTDTVFFTADGGAATGRELYRTTNPLVPGGTNQVQDLTGGAGSTTFFPKLFPLGSRVYFFAKVGAATQWQLYSVTAGGSPITLGAALPANFDPANFTVGGPSGTEMYFTVSDTTNNQYRLYKIDGGTTPSLTNIETFTTASFGTSGSNNLAYANGFVYFAARDTPNGTELWRSNGTVGNAALVTNIRAAGADSAPTDFAAVNGVVYFAATNNAAVRQLYQTTGSAPSTIPAPNANVTFSTPTKLTVFKGQLVFVAKNGGGAERLYQYDPINHQIFNDPVSNLPGFDGYSGAAAFGAFTPVGETLFLQLNDGATGLEPYSFDPVPDAPFFDQAITVDSGVAADPTTLTDLRTNTPSSVKLTGKADAAGQVIDVRDVFNGGSAVSLGGTFSVAADGAFTYNTPSLAEGTHVLTATAADSTGMSPNSLATLTVVIDRTPPTTPVITGDAQSGEVIDVTTNLTSVTIAGTGAEANSFVTLYPFQSVTPVQSFILVNGSGVWSTTVSSLTDGLHEYRVTGIDRAGNETPLGTVDAYVVSVDTVAPVAPVITGIITDSGPSAADNYTNDTTPALYGTAEPFVTVNVFVGSGASPAFLGFATADAQGDWSYPIPGPLMDGIYQYRAKAKDSANNVSAVFSNMLNVTIDMLPAATPTFTNFSFDSGTVGDNRTNDTTLTLTGTADAFASITVKEGATGRGTATADSGGVWTVTTAALAEGAHTFTVDATDLAGNLNTTPLTTPPITIDTTPPGAPAITGVSVDSGSSSSDGVTKNTSLTISGTFVAGTASVTVKDGANTLGLATLGAGTWTYAVSGLSEGLHNFTAVAADAAANPASSAVYPVTVDTMVPATPVYTSFSDDTGTLGDNKTRDNTLTLTGTAEVGAVVNVFQNGTSVGPATRSGANWSFTSAVLTDGGYTYTVTATDLAGNVSGSPAIPTITIDSTLPERPIITGITTDTGFSPTDGITSDTTLTVAGTTTAGTTVTVNDGGSLLGTATITGTGTTWSFDTGTLSANTTHNLTATSLDGLGNSVTSAVFPVVIDTVAPGVPVYSNFTPDTGAPNDNRTNSATITLNGVAETNAIITVKEGLITLGTTTATGGNWGFLTPALADGTHIFTITATDAAGKESLTLTPPPITVDLMAPAAPVIVTMTTDSGASATDGVTNDTTLKLDGTLTAEAGGTTAVDIYDGMTLLGPAVISGSGWTFNTAALAPGNYNFIARATDAAGNTADSAVKAVTVDTTAPATPAFTAYSDDTGAPGDGLTGDQTLTLTGTAEAGALITVKEGSVTVGTATATGVAGVGVGAWTVTTSALPDGSHTLAVTATDLAGNVSAALTLPMVIVDATAPAAPTLNGFVAVSPLPAVTFGLTTSATVITLSGSTGEEGLPVTVLDGNTPLSGTLIYPGGGTWTLTTGALSAGTHTFTAKTLDAAGNASPVSAALVVEVDPALTTPDLVVPEKDKNVITLKGSQILAAHAVTDTAGALKGLAVTGLTGNGVWSYSAGGKVIPLAAGALTPTHALLLRDTDVLKFTPAADFVGLARVTYRAWDQTGGRPGEFAAVGAGGVMTPFSDTPRTFVLGISETNDRPTLKLTDSPLMQPGVATTVGALLKGRFADVDAFKIPGIAVVGAVGAGTWEYKSPTGAYVTMDKPSAAKAILLDETYSVRFRPDSGFKGKATLVYVPWDGSAGGAAGAVGVKANTTAFGAKRETATVNAGNSAPVLALPAQTPALPPVAEDTASPTGYKVSALIKDAVTDVDGLAAVGIAVTDVDNAFGQWQFMAKGGWKPLAGATSTNVLLLSGAGQLRFVPNANQSGVASVTYRAWDGSTGFSGEWADPTGDTAFSSAVETATVTVTPVNDRPVLLTAGTPVLPSLPAIIAAGSIPGTLVSALIGGFLSDAETLAANVGIAVTAVTGNGRWQYRRDSGATSPANKWLEITPVSAGAALLLAPNQFVRFVPTAIPQSQPQIATLSFKGWDVSQGSGTATGTARVDTRTSFAFSEATETAYVSQGNQRPTLSAAAVFPDLTEDPKKNDGQGVKALLGTTESLGNAPLAGEGQGIAVTAVDNTGGKWQYALTNKFVDIPAVSNTNALLLPDSAKLKFVPNADFNGAAGKINYKAWDRTVGAPGEFADTLATNAFSTDPMAGPISTGPTVTAVNDRPVVAVGTAVVLTPLALGYDTTANPGDGVANLLPAGAVSQPADEGNTFGIAVTGLSGVGTWQFSTDNGATWADIVKPSAGKPLLLASTAKVRFTATTPGNAGQATITYKAWDGTATDTALSIGSLTATVSVGNSAPMQ